MSANKPRERPLIAFFDYPDVFEDFYPHYGVDQQAFATRWAATANHAFVALLQREIGDVIWYVFSLEPELSRARHEVVGCQVKVLPSSRVHRWLWRTFYLSPNAWRWRRAAYPAYATAASYLALASRPFIRMLWQDRPDFFFVQDYATGRFDMLLLAARMLGVPLIAYHSGSQPEHYLAGNVKRWTIPRADRLITSSQGELEMLASRYRVSRSRLTTILTPVDIQAFRPLDRAAACRATGLDRRRRYLLFMGRLDDRVKCVSALIRSFAMLASDRPDVDLVIAGIGPSEQQLRDMAGACAPGRVRFLGWIAGSAAKAQLYNTAECLVLPSRSEGFPTVVGEALACGTPVLASDVGGVRELVVQDATGWLIPPDDDEALIAGLSLVAAQPEIVASMRWGARRMAEDCVSPAVVADQLRQCFSRSAAVDD